MKTAAKFLPATTRRRCHWQCFAIATVAGLGGMGLPQYAAHAAEPAADPATVITLDNQLRFTPAKVTVQAGDTVEWRNTSVLVHTVTDDPELVAKDADYGLPDGAKPFNSGNLRPKGTFAHTFTVPGTYKYFCIPHEGAGMIAELVVTK